MDPIMFLFVALLVVVAAKVFGFVPFGFTVLVPDVGEVQLLTMALSKATVETQTLKLYKTDVTPAEAHTAASYTEMTGQGYAAKTLARASWSIATATGVTTASYPQQTYTFTGGGPDTIYGYFVIETTSTVILGAEKFATSQVVQNNGDQILITPKITLD